MSDALTMGTDPRSFDARCTDSENFRPAEEGKGMLLDLKGCIYSASMVNYITAM